MTDQNNVTDQNKLKEQLLSQIAEQQMQIIDLQNKQQQLIEILDDNEAYFRVIFDRAAIGITLVDVREKRIVKCNPAFEVFIGYSAAELAALTIDDISYPADMAITNEFLAELMGGKRECFQMEKRYLHKDGRLVWGRLTASLVSPSGDAARYMIGMVEDITERKSAEEKLRWNEMLLRLMASSVPYGLLAVDNHTETILYANEQFCNIWGVEHLWEQLQQGSFKARDLYSRCLYLLIDPETFLEKIRSLQHQENECDVDEEINFTDGRIIRCFTTNIMDRYSRCDARFYIFEDITKRKQLEEALRRSKEEAERAREQAELLAATDYLTGQLNWRAFMARLRAEFSRAQRNNAPLSIILTDLDRFKKVNDSYGHLVGDAVLQNFTACLSRLCRPYDFIGRYGGEEFIICLPDVNLKQAIEIAKRMCKAVSKEQMYCSEGICVNITASFGVATLDNVATGDVDELIARADEALYQAKVSGRNCVCAAGE